MQTELKTAQFGLVGKFFTTNERYVQPFPREEDYIPEFPESDDEAEEAVVLVDRWLTLKEGYNQRWKLLYKQWREKRRIKREGM
jgi:hypothetical protein